MYETKRKLRRDRDGLREQLASARQHINTKEGQLLAKDELIAMFEDDQQHLAESLWEQRTRSRFAFEMQMGLISLTLFVASAAGAVYVFYTWGFKLITAPVVVPAAFFGWLLVRLARNIEEPSNHIELPSGEVVPIRRHVAERVHNDIVQAARG